MNMLDYFNNDVFGLTSLTNAINLLPFVPSRIGQMGLFSSTGVNTTTVVLEEKNGILSLLPTKHRGANNNTQAKDEKRVVRSFVVPHIPYDDTILAASIQNVRQFGSNDRLQSLVQVVNDKMSQMRQDHEVTLEYHRIGAIKGVILDADGSTTIYDLFNEYGVTRPSVNFDLEDQTTDIRAKCVEVLRAIEEALGARMYQGVHAMCGASFFDDFIGHEYVRDAYHRYQDSINLRNDVRKGFEFGGITFEEYRGKIGNVDFVPDTEANFFPVGVPGLFVTYNAPADFVETVNTLGLPIYAKQERLKFDKGIEIHTQSNPLCLCTQPKVLVQGTASE